MYYSVENIRFIRKTILDMISYDVDYTDYKPLNGQDPGDEDSIEFRIRHYKATLQDQIDVVNKAKSGDLFLLRLFPAYYINAWLTPPLVTIIEMLDKNYCWPEYEEECNREYMRKIKPNEGW